MTTLDDARTIEMLRTELTSALTKTGRVGAGGDDRPADRVGQPCGADATLTTYAEGGARSRPW